MVLLIDQRLAVQSTFSYNVIMTIVVGVFEINNI